jgi:hypothetical protein
MWILVPQTKISGFSAIEVLYVVQLGTTAERTVYESISSSVRLLAILNWKAPLNDQLLMLRWVRIELLLFALQKEEQSFRQAYHNRRCTKFCEVVWGLRVTDTCFPSVFIKPRQKKRSLCTLLWRAFKNWKKKKNNEKKFLLQELFLVTKPLSSSPAILTL